jgi:hypothetical protein
MDLSSTSSSSISTSLSDSDWEHVFSAQPSGTDNTRRHNPRAQMIDGFLTGILHQDMDPYHSDSSSNLGTGFWTRTYRRTQPETEEHASDPAQPPDTGRSPGRAHPLTPEGADSVNLASDNRTPDSMTSSPSLPDPVQYTGTQSSTTHHPVYQHRNTQSI